MSAADVRANPLGHSRLGPRLRQPGACRASFERAYDPAPPPPPGQDTTRLSHTTLQQIAAQVKA
eukprot:1522795-Rhodomonas_salina.2